MPDNAIEVNGIDSIGEDFGASPLTGSSNSRLHNRTRSSVTGEFAHGTHAGGSFELLKTDPSAVAAVCLADLLRITSQSGGDVSVRDVQSW